MKNTKLALMFAMAIAVAKQIHDNGQSKIWFILIMIIAISSLSALNYYLIAAFLAPLLFYVIDTGNYHAANLRSRPKPNDPKPFKSYWILDKPIHWLAVWFTNVGDVSPYIRTEKWEIEYYQARGFASCILCSVVFTLPFMLTNIVYGLPLLLWPFCVKYITWGIKQPDGTRGSEWWWVCTFILFFSYSLLFFMSL